MFDCKTSIFHLYSHLTVRCTTTFSELWQTTFSPWLHVFWAVKESSHHRNSLLSLLPSAKRNTSVKTRIIVILLFTHPSINFNIQFQDGGEAQTSLFLVTSFRSSRGISKHFQASWYIWSRVCPRICSGRRVWLDISETCPGRPPKHIPEQPQLSPPNVEEEQLYSTLESELLTLSLKGRPATLQRKLSFRFLYS